MKQKLMEVVNGVVENIAVFDSENIPDFAQNWEVAPDYVGRKWLYDGQTFSPPPGPTSAELDALAEKIVAKVFEEQKDATRAMGETLAEVIFRVSNGTVPQNVTEAQARQWVMDTFLAKYRALL